MYRIAFILFSFVVLTTSTTVLAHTDDEMIDLAKLVTGNDLTIDHWQVTIKEQLDNNRVQDTLRILKDSYLATVKEDENAIKYYFGDTHKSERITESFEVIIPKKDIYNAEFIAIIEGNTWNDRISKEYNSEVNRLFKRHFTGSAKKFACLSTEYDDIIKSDYVLNMLKKQFKLQHITTQTDKITDSMIMKIISGYTPLWEKQITIMDIPINVHMAIKQQGNNQAKVTLGTPIMINEY